MEEVEKETPVSVDEPVDVAAGPAEAEAPKGVEAAIEETLTPTKVISRLRAIVIELKGGSLVIGGVPVGELTDPVDFELEYSEKGGKHELEIELKW